MKWKQILLTVAISGVTAVASVWGYSKFVQQKTVVLQAQGNLPVNYAGYIDGNTGMPPGAVDFTQAASTAVQAVVHIKTKIPAQRVSNNNNSTQRQRGFFDDWFDQFFDGPQVIPEQRASGSGVIISQDGYIVTNNHVIDNQKGGVADEINVTLHNKKTYKARVIGRDPSSDIAVLKIDGENLPTLIYGNSDDVKLGQWVLAVGYPLTLETTVTAGIVSAKGRSIGINQRQTQGNVSPVESFIQTDAAVNQGNSGGALITTEGTLIGINSAILAPTGTYAGYSFAIPVNIVKKIVKDIIEFGDVQRGFLGITYYPGEYTEEQLKELGIKELDGVYVTDVSTGGAAKEAGIKKGDIITKVNNTPVFTGIEMSAQIAPFRPGDKVPVSYKRNGKEYTTHVVLKAKTPSFDIVNNLNINDKIGADLATISSKDASRYDIDGGVEVKNIYKGGALSRTRMDEGFIITSVNGQSVKNIEDLVKLLNTPGRTRFTLEGVYPGSGIYRYPLELGDD